MNIITGLLFIALCVGAVYLAYKWREEYTKNQYEKACAICKNYIKYLKEQGKYVEGVDYEGAFMYSPKQYMYLLNTGAYQFIKPKYRQRIIDLDMQFEATRSINTKINISKGSCDLCISTASALEKWEPPVVNLKIGRDEKTICLCKKHLIEFNNELSEYVKELSEEE